MTSSHQLNQDEDELTGQGPQLAIINFITRNTFSFYETIGLDSFLLNKIFLLNYSS